MTHSIETLVGRLITDADFRNFFLGDPGTTLQMAGDWGLRLSDSDIRAFLATDATLWDRVADELDARLQRARLVSQ